MTMNKSVDIVCAKSNIQKLTAIVMQRALHSFTDRITCTHNTALLVNVLAGVSLVQPQSAFGSTSVLHLFQCI